MSPTLDTAAPDRAPSDLALLAAQADVAAVRLAATRRALLVAADTPMVTRTGGGASGALARIALAAVFLVAA
ncbi:hypothetical protein [Oharaeibacter diazotrophicus]|uniref:Uncharacterized protein n=1 Tax=Oharaeibacter diazotrophicus TaxID=1920512 RepID=A0A4R6RN51_9HYPH|nr:hypothetical protein [Oharaeibacter diazotrophicus]TDP87236.1 hypothetical protein EDD54_1125 [Oharaeibacter diazotrophicus]BBE70821.1 hypothetical protein OHA_1_00388 [Pleomorphomonas sp. SM30]GLS77569.1 hypothetical protein GCM10007904_29060 [Oharaeibacter diazotrophicus]